MYIIYVYIHYTHVCKGDISSARCIVAWLGKTRDGPIQLFMHAAKLPTKPCDNNKHEAELSAVIITPA